LIKTEVNCYLDTNNILSKQKTFCLWSGIGTGCPGRWWSPHPWRCLKNM